MKSFYLRTGLIRARQEGVKVANGDVVVILDTHCEVLPDWLRPLLQRIKAKKDAVVLPDIEAIDYDTFLFVNTTMDDQVASHIRLYVSYNTLLCYCAVDQHW